MAKKRFSPEQIVTLLRQISIFAAVLGSLFFGISRLSTWSKVFSTV